MLEETDEFTKAAAGVSAITTTRPEEDAWRVHVAFGFPQQEGAKVLRTIAVLVVPADPDDIPAGGLTQRRLQQLVTGITSDAAADVHVRQRQQTFERDGHAMTPKEVQELTNELRRRGRSGKLKGKKRGFGPDFYATVALDAIDVAGKGRLRDVNMALAKKYRKSDPRPPGKRIRAVESTTVRGWVSTARGKDYGFLPASGGKGRRVYAPTAALIAHLGGVVMNVDVPMTVKLTAKLIPAKKGKEKS